VKRLALSFVALVAPFLLFAESPVRLEGSVVTAEGSPIAGALVGVSESEGEEILAATDENGRFTLELLKGTPALLRVRADEFIEKLVFWQGAEPLRIVLSPLSFADEVTVTAARGPTRIRETAASVVFVSSQDMAEAAPPALDAILRQVPGFSLFRRSDSRTANPTTQGASLRGLGGSGTSRALVLDDGIPLNDPFGGWIAWGRVVDDALDRVEIVRGGSSDLYGAPALSGVIQMIRRDPAESALSAEASYGSQDTADAAAFAAGRFGSWTARISAGAYRTSGYVVVPESLAGTVDVPVDSRHETAEATLEHADEQARVFLRGAFYDEERDNGTPLQTNDTRLWQISAGAEGNLGRSSYRLRVYGLDSMYHQTFTAVSSDRNSESLTRLQEVPASAGGGTAQWEAALGAHHFLFGLEGRLVSGASNETVGAAGDRISDSGGKQGTAAAFVEDRIALSSRMTLAAALRFDAWRNFDAFRKEGESDSHPPEVPLESKSANAWSPRLALVYQASPATSLTASVYRSFRAPTLNELYRTFRVGNVVTLANDDLGPERLTGGEVGALVSPPGTAVYVRATAFWMEIDDTIVNRTLEVTPSLITRRRENVGTTRSRGVEVDLEARLSQALWASAGYLYVDSSVIRSPDPSIEGRRIPQVPRNQATLQLRGEAGPGRLAVQVRYAAAQFDDDLNAFRLPGFVSLDARAGWALTRAVEAFVAGENLTGKQAVTGRTPRPTLGPPRQVRGGVRVTL